MAKQTVTKRRMVFWRAAATILLVVVAGAVLAAHWHTVSASLRIARGAKLSWLLGALIAMAATFCIAAALYGVLALHRLRYTQTVLVELATAFVNRLLPAGLGGLGLNGVYLYKHKHTVAEATAIVSVNNLIGMIAHLGLFFGALLVYPSVFKQFAVGLHIHGSWQAGLLGLITIGLVVLLPNMRRRVAGFVRNVWQSLRRLHAANMLSALGLAALLTVTYTAILYSVAHSVGLTLTPLRVFIVFSAGILAGTVTPTPGGLIGAEAGLFAGFVAYGAADAPAAAAVLLYRLITYWLPLLPGLGALLIARRQKLV